MKEQRRHIFGLVGHPLGHSFSRGYFNDKFAKEDIYAEYVNYDIPDVGGLRELIESTPDLCGLNVTIPYKRDVMALLDEVDPGANKIGAVNVIKIIRTLDGVRLKGYNTDVTGFGRALDAFGFPERCRGLVLGTGGASLAVVAALHERGIEVSRVSRTPKAPGDISYSDLDAATMRGARVIVNATPLGTWPDVDECPPIPYDFVGPEHVCLDLVYNPAVTEFMSRCSAHGAAVRNGLCMLIGQALDAWKIWNE